MRKPMVMPAVSLFRSAPATSATPAPGPRRRQIAAVWRLEAARYLRGRRALVLYALAALAPLVVVGLLWTSGLGHGMTSAGWLQDPQRASGLFARLFDGLIVRTVVFFGCAWLFLHLMRGEIAARTLHYYFLAPLPREAVVVAKYLAGVTVAAALFGGSTLLATGLLDGRGGLARWLTNGVGARDAAYVGIVILGCIGYGALFSAVGLAFRNPVVPVLVIYFWEAALFLLPPVLQRISIVHYLQALAPVPLEPHSVAVLAPPLAPVTAVVSLVALSAVLLYGAARRARGLEIAYGQDDA